MEAKQRNTRRALSPPGRVVPAVHARTPMALPRQAGARARAVGIGPHAYCHDPSAHASVVPGSTKLVVEHEPCLLAQDPFGWLVGWSRNNSRGFYAWGEYIYTIRTKYCNGVEAQ